MKFKLKHYTACERSNKLPRKVKKYLLGKKIGKSKLKEKIRSYKDGDNWFCPECGCMHLKYWDHGVEFPEIWVDLLCGRCGYVVASADNSKMEFVLDELE